MSNIEKIKAEIERRIKACKTKNGFPAGTICAIRIETYEGLLSFIDTLLEEKQKEPHYTKRNELFDKCVENCDPKTVEEVNKRVDDIMNMPELSPFEQALTNFIGDWEDDEEHWPSQFVKKHGKHILDMAREELQKEQHPSPRFLPGDWVVYDGPLGHAILQVKDVVGGRYTFVDNDSTLLVEDSDKFLRPLTPKDMEKPAEWSEGNYDIIPNISYQVYKAIRRTLASLAVYDEDEELLESKEATLCYYSQQCAEAILKSLRPSWKPSEEQLSMLLAVINDPNNAGAESCYMALKSIYNNLKKL